MYSDLYNSVSTTPVHIVDSLHSKINKPILDSHETHQPHITNCDVRTAMKGLKSYKSDGFTDLTSDSLNTRLHENIGTNDIPFYKERSN